MTDSARPPSPPRPAARFSDWVRDFGVQRQDGWLGGVAAGIAARVRVDPLVIRGILAVTAILGLPMLLLYAIAWALLPDTQDRVPLQRLFQRRPGPELVGILVLAIVGLLPVVPWFFGVVWGIWTFTGSGAQLLITLLVLAAIVGIAYLISRVWARGTAERRTEAHHDGASAAAAAYGTGASEISGLDAPGSVSDASDAALTPPAEPPAPASDAPDDEVAAWRAQHAAWKEQEAAWRAGQQDAERAAKAQARAERQERAAAFAAEAAERRRVRRLSRPRASAAYVAVVAGAAIILAAIVTLVGLDDPLRSLAQGLFTGALVMALGMIGAGLARRRSGMLTFLTAALLVGGVAAGAPAVAGNLRLGSVSVSNDALSAGDGTLVVRWGSIDLTLFNRGDFAEPIALESYDGRTYIHVESGIALQLSAQLGPDVPVSWIRYTPSGDAAMTEIPVSGRALTRTFADETQEPGSIQAVRLIQHSGGIVIYSEVSYEIDPATGEGIIEEIL